MLVFSIDICLRSCQKWSGGAYTSNIVVPRKNFKVTKGSPKNYNVKGDSGKMNNHWFCGSTLFSFLVHVGNKSPYPFPPLRE